MSEPARATDDAATTLTRARTIAGAMVGSVLLAGVVAAWVRFEARSDLLTAPAGILGIVSPVIGYRLYHLQRDRVRAVVGEAERRARFLRALLAGLAVGEAAALLGVVAFALSGEPSTLIGLVTHVILVGALWPTEEKLEAFCVPETDPGAGG